MTDVRSRFFDAVPHMAELGIGFENIGAGEATLRLPYHDKLVGNVDTGVLAGGAVTSLIDTACGAAALSRLAIFQPIATLDLRIDYLKPAAAGSDVFAFAQCYRLSRWIAFVRGTAYNDDIDNPIANCTAAFMATGEQPFPKASRI